jgi:purine nucleosidase
MRRLVPFLVGAALVACGFRPAQGDTVPATKIKVIADQDSAGPAGTNFLSLLMLLRAPQVDLLGITTVSGDQWVEPATVFALWATEITKRTDVPVIKGAELPLLNTQREQEAREKMYGSYLGWHGSFTLSKGNMASAGRISQSKGAPRPRGGLHHRHDPRQSR